MKRIALIIGIMLLALPSGAQKYMTRNGYIGFYSHTALEDIKADNNQVASVLDITTGGIVFQVLIKSFKFDKALMEEHFNENYLESEKFPKATFNGKIANLADMDFSKNGTYDVTVEGDLTIHGVTNKVSSKGSLEVKPDGIYASSKFNLIPEDYKIEIPGIVRNNIAKSMEITVTMKYEPVVGK
jgi:polyisoprenoid-binding protein YceI